MLKGLGSHIKRWPAKTHGAGLIIVLLSAGLFIFNLGNWTAGMSPQEASAVSGSSDASALINNPLNLPQKLIQYLFHSLGWHTLGWNRLASAILAISLMAAFYGVCRQLFGRQTAFFSSLIALATGWLLIGGRQATPIILSLFLLFPIAALIWLKQRPTGLFWIVFCSLTSLALYVPGSLWLLIILLAFGWRQLKALKQTVPSSTFWIGLIIGLIMLAPLAYGLTKHPGLIRGWLLIPQAFMPAFDTIKNIGWAFSGLVWQTKQHFNLTIGHWPMLNVIEVILVFFGLFACWQKARQLFYVCLAVIMFSALVAGLNNNFELLLFCLPAFGLLMAAGVRYLFLEWQTVFPRNPIPRGVGLILLAALAAVQLWYGVRYSQAAWPNTPETKAVYVIK